jgi:hypothetical protein
MGCKYIRIMDLAARKYRLIERLTNLVSAEKLDSFFGSWTMLFKQKYL